MAKVGALVAYVSTAIQQTILARLPRSEALSTRSLLIGTYYALIALLVFYPYLGKGYILTLDMVLGPETNFVTVILDRKGALFYGRLLPAILFDGIIALGVPVWVLQQGFLLGIVWLSGVSTYVATRGASGPARVAAGTLYCFNPFVYTRLLAGHWWILIAYAVLPLAVRLFYEVATDSDEHYRSPMLAAGVVITVVAAFGPHVVFLFAVTAAVITVVVLGDVWWASGDVQAPLRRIGILTGGVSLVNTYWLVPAVWAFQTGVTRTSAFTLEQLRAFETSGVIAGDSILTTTMMYGFWRAGYQLLPVSVGDTAVVALFLPLLALVMIGATGETQAPRTWRIVGVVIVLFGIFLGAGYGSPLTRGLYVWLYSTVPGFFGMRESQKFVALAVMGYSFLIAVGIDETSAILREQLRPHREASAEEDDRDVRTYITMLKNLDASFPTRQSVATVLALGVIVVALVYSSPMIGLGNQVNATDYPDSWYTMDAELEQRVTGNERVLFLPYHQYMYFPWVGREVVPPAQHLFPNTVRGRNIEVAGAATEPRDPTHQRLRPLIADYTRQPERVKDEPFGNQVSEVGVQYIVLAEVADHQRYQFLEEDPSLEQIRTVDDLVLYRVVEPAPEPSNGWPRAGAPRLLAPLWIGCAASLAALLGIVGVVTRRNTLIS